MNKIQLGFNIAITTLLIFISLLLIRLGKDSEIKAYNEVERFNKLMQIESNMKYITKVSASIDSILTVDAQNSLNEIQAITESNNFVNKIPHLPNDTLSIYYQNSWDYLLGRYRAGTLRPTKGE